jgi:hypothetical protein
LLIEPESEMTETSQSEMDNFISMMEEMTGRNVFLDYLGTNYDKKDIKLPCKKSFENLSKLIIACFDRILKHDDRQNSFKLVEACNRFYYEQIPSK